MGSGTFIERHCNVTDPALGEVWIWHRVLVGVVGWLVEGNTRLLG